MQSNEISADRRWQTAGDRVFLYLRCLNLPAAQAHELALRALNEAEQNIAGGDSGKDPVAEALDVLDGLLGELIQKTNGDFPGPWCRQNLMSKTAGEEIIPSGHEGSAFLPSSAPPIRRLHMRARELERSHLRSLFGNLAGRRKRHSGGVE